MCPFCILALALVAAKAVAATGGGAILTGVLVNKVRKGSEPGNVRTQQVPQSETPVGSSD